MTMTTTHPPPPAPPDTDAAVDEEEEAERARAALYHMAVHERDPTACMEWLRLYAGWSTGESDTHGNR